MKHLLYTITMLILLSACEDNDPTQHPDEIELQGTTDNLIIVNEGNWQSDNGQLSFLDSQTGVLTNQWFRKINGYKLGDTPNHIIQVNDTLIAITVNWSNIIQFIHPDGTACGATESIPNNRCLCTDGNYLYATSYAHICGNETFEKGFVAKIDLKSLKITGTCQTGWEPEGIALYNGKLFIANSGGYAFSERSHDYETTISVIDAQTMQHVKTIDTGCPNLYGKISLAGKYLCISSCGDYYTTEPQTIVLDCETYEFKCFDFASTVTATDGKNFFCFGSSFNYTTGQYTTSSNTIKLPSMEIVQGILNSSITQALHDAEAVYAIYVSPYTGNFYFTDARSYATSGLLYGFAPDGTQLFAPQQLYVNPGSIIALPPPAHKNKKS